MRRETTEEIVKIKTLKDIIDKVPAQTLDYFLEDLKQWVLLHQGIEIAKKAKEVSDNIDIKTSETMQWMDNSDTGKHEQNINIKIVQLIY